MSLNKKLDNIKIGIAISTYTTEKTDSDRYEIINQTLQSLQKLQDTTSLNLYIVIVIDGPIPQKHQDLINQYNISTYHRKKNGGVAKTKNTSIRILLEEKVDIGFLGDDDIIIEDGCIEKYCQTMLDGKIHHMVLCPIDEIVHPKNEWEKMGYRKIKYNGINVMQHTAHCGCWLSFTPELITKVGYFKILPGKYGYEHMNFSHRCINQGMIPFGIDIIDAPKYIRHIGFIPVSYNKYHKVHSIDEKERILQNNLNKKVWNKNLNEYCKLIE